MKDLRNWTEVTKGLYRYITEADECYEIHVLCWYYRTDILSAEANAYFVGNWRTNVGGLFERELLATGSVSACIDAAMKDCVWEASK